MADNETEPTALYAIRVVATGEVRDADGNVIETVPIESEQHVLLTEAQARALATTTQEEAS